ncbi:hypothetical protein G9A89_006562 [Geosiphon pyriformis]|nr:hypothetical protein G9A89_006562 [Geosiphon pyriformis]
MAKFHESWEFEEDLTPHPAFMLSKQLVTKIAKCLDSQADRLNLCLVNKTWSPTAIEVLWSEPVFKSPESLHYFIRTVQLSKLCALRVRVLNLCAPEEALTHAFAPVLQSSHEVHKRMEAMLLSQIKFIMNIIRLCENLQSLKVYGWNLADNHIHSIPQYCRDLRELRVIGNKNLTQQAFYSLINSVASDLNVLDLDGVFNLSDNFAETLATKCPNLTFLKLCTQKMSSVGFDILAKKFSNLCELILQDCLNITDANIAHFVENNSKLRVLALSSKCLTIESFKIIMYSLGNLQNLDLRCSFRNQDAPHSIQWFMPIAVNLRVLLLHAQPIDDELLDVVAITCKRLEKFGLSHCSFVTDESIRSITENAKHLETVNLVHCAQITEYCLKYLGLNKGASLTEVIIDSCEAFTPEAVHWFSRTASQLDRLAIHGMRSIIKDEIYQFSKEYKFSKENNEQSDILLCTFEGENLKRLAHYQRLSLSCETSNYNSSTQQHQNSTDAFLEKSLQQDNLLSNLSDSAINALASELGVKSDLVNKAITKVLAAKVNRPLAEENQSQRQTSNSFNATDSKDSRDILFHEIDVKQDVSSSHTQKFSHEKAEFDENKQRTSTSKEVRGSHSPQNSTNLTSSTRAEDWPNVIKKTQSGWATIHVKLPSLHTPPSANISAADQILSKDSPGLPEQSNISIKSNLINEQNKESRLPAQSPCEESRMPPGGEVVNDLKPCNNQQERLDPIKQTLVESKIQTSALIMAEAHPAIIHEESNSTTTSTKPSLPKNIKFLSSELDKNEDNSSSWNNFDEDSVQEELGGWEEMGDEGAKVNKSLSSTNIQNGEWPAKHSEAKEFQNKGGIEMEFKDDENSHEVFKTTHSPTKEDILMILEDDEWSTEDSDTDPENDENDQVPKIQLIPQSIQSTSPSIKKPTDIQQQESIVDDSNDRSEDDLGGWGEMGVGQISTYGWNRNESSFANHLAKSEFSRDSSEVFDEKPSSITCVKSPEEVSGLKQEKIMVINVPSQSHYVGAESITADPDVKSPKEAWPTVSLSSKEQMKLSLEEWPSLSNDSKSQNEIELGGWGPISSAWGTPKKWESDTVNSKTETPLPPEWNPNDVNNLKATIMPEPKSPIYFDKKKTKPLVFSFDDREGWGAPPEKFIPWNDHSRQGYCYDLIEEQNETTFWTHTNGNWINVTENQKTKSIAGSAGYSSDGGNLSKRNGDRLEDKQKNRDRGREGITNLDTTTWDVIREQTRREREERGLTRTNERGGSKVELSDSDEDFKLAKKKLHHNKLVYAGLSRPKTGISERLGDPKWKSEQEWRKSNMENQSTCNSLINVSSVDSSDVKSVSSGTEEDLLSPVESKKLIKPSAIDTKDNNQQEKLNLKIDSGHGSEEEHHGQLKLAPVQVTQSPEDQIMKETQPEKCVEERPEAIQETAKRLVLASEQESLLINIEATNKENTIETAPPKNDINDDLAQLQEIFTASCAGNASSKATNLDVDRLLSKRTNFTKDQNIVQDIGSLSSSELSKTNTFSASGDGVSHKNTAGICVQPLPPPKSKVSGNALFSVTREASMIVLEIETPHDGSQKFNARIDADPMPRVSDFCQKYGMEDYIDQLYFMVKRRIKKVNSKSKKLSEARNTLISLVDEKPNNGAPLC